MSVTQSSSLVKQRVSETKESYDTAHESDKHVLILNVNPCIESARVRM